MSAAPPPNWYPDPHDQAQLRWWDGSKWTDHLHALVPETALVPDTAVATEPAETVEQPIASVPRSTVDQWSVAEVPERDVQAARVGDLAPQEPIGRSPGTETVGQSWQPEEPTWATPMPAPLSLQVRGDTSPPSRRPMIIGAALIAVLLVGAVAFVLTRDGDDGGDVVSQSPATSVGVTTTVSTTVSTSTVSTAANASTQPPATTTPATTAPALGGTTFTDATNAYRLRVAPEWQDATVVGGLQTWSTGTNSNVFRDSVNVLIEKLPGDISIDDYLAASVRNAPKSLPSFVEVGRSVNTVNGKVLGQLDFRSNQNIPLRHRAVVLIKGRNAIVVTYTTEPARFDAESVKVQPYLTSVEGV